MKSIHLAQLALAITCFPMAAVLVRAQTAEDVFRAIRAGDNSTLSKMPVDVKDHLDTTPLHYAALYGNTESVRILLDRGADPNARNKSEATPLIYGAYNFDKTRLLIEKGGDVNAQSSIGSTPLSVAAFVHGNAATVRLLLEKGAAASGARRSPLLTAYGPLLRAAYGGDPETVQLLLEKGADPKRKTTVTALGVATFGANYEAVGVLIAAGCDVNEANTFSFPSKHSPTDLDHLTPLFLAAPGAETATIKALLAAGAHPDEADQRKMTPLMNPIATDEPKLATIRMLIAAHADVNAKDRYGDSILDWGLKFHNPEVLAILKEAGAQSARPFVAPKRPADFTAGSPKDAIARSTALLAQSGETFFTESACVACHHQALNARAFAALRAATAHPDERLRRAFLDGVTALRPDALASLPLLGGGFPTMVAVSRALADLGEPPTPFTDAQIHFLAAMQQDSGAWTHITTERRPPLESSAISDTAMAIRALATYGWPARRAEFDERIGKARVWLLAAEPVTRYEEADRIAGLKAAGVPVRDLAKPARALLAEQRADGGWSQTPYLESDAYATGTVLSTLYQNGLMKPSDPAYVRGVAYLLKTQFPDGSWYVRSRSPKLQPYFQSAFPFEHDQWISAAATALAVMALAPAQF
jgi:ankyrin repeat protein